MYRTITRMLLPVAGLAAAIGVACGNTESNIQEPVVIERNVSEYQDVEIAPTYTFTPAQEEPTQTPTQTYVPLTSTPILPAPTEIPIHSISDFLELENQLTEKVRRYENELGMNLAIAVTDLQTRVTISVDGREPHRPGCTTNQFAVYAVVEEFQKGNASPDEMGWYIRNSVDHSNPASTAAFLAHYFGSREEGERRVQQWMDENGVEGLYDHVPTFFDGTNNMLMAEETNEVLERLYLGELFNDEWTAYTMDVLTYNNFLYAIPSGVDADATVAHKIGYHWDVDGWVHNDAGIVMFPGDDGTQKAFVISIFTAKGAGQYSFAPIARDLTSIVYQHFRQGY